jgi:hypothetical protein
VRLSAKRRSASTPARLEYGKGTYIGAGKKASIRSAGGSLLASVLVRQDEKLAAFSDVFMAAASAAGTHGGHVHLEHVAYVWEAEQDAVIAVPRGLDPSVVDHDCAPSAVFMDGVDGERRTGPGRRGRWPLCAP